jgi:ChrR Cupin-like domain
MGSDSVEVVDSAAMEWERGIDVVNSMAPEWRTNLGDDESVERAYQLYFQKTLYADPSTTRKVDVIRCDPGYADVTAAYHDSVEESYVLAGVADMANEGAFGANGYFWRPPGWIHRGRTEVGFTSVLFIEGNNPSEGSGPASRRIYPDDTLGQYGLNAKTDEERFGPRGWPRYVDTAVVPWQPAVNYARSQAPLGDFGLDQCQVKVLSSNVYSGSQTVLLGFKPGYSQGSSGHYLSGVELFVLSGSLRHGGRQYSEGTYVRIPAGVEIDPLESSGGARVLAKCDGLLGFVAGSAVRRQ